MLQAMSDQQRKALALAERLENLPEGEFEMRSWVSCISGHLHRMGLCPQDIGLDTSGKEAAMFEPTLLRGPGDTTDEETWGAWSRTMQDSKLAASVVRHFALTGEINWDRRVEC